jgi:Transposase IS116/IS110/IS902 family
LSSCNNSNTNTATIQKDIIGKIEVYSKDAASLIDSNASIEIIGRHYQWSEGPVWIASKKMLLFSDVRANTVFHAIKTDKMLLQMFMLITGIPSIGKITAYHFICYTNEFKEVKSGKQLASYCGVVPFEKSSGSSVKKKPRLSHQGNKILKTLLHLCAVTSIKMKGEFADYYRKKVAEGKSGLIAINGIRNKLALTVAAVIRNNKPYVENYAYQP